LLLGVRVPVSILPPLRRGAFRVALRDTRPAPRLRSVTTIRPLRRGAFRVALRDTRPAPRLRSVQPTNADYDKEENPSLLGQNRRA